MRQSNDVQLKQRFRPLAEVRRAAKNHVDPHWDAPLARGERLWPPGSPEE